MAYGLSREGGSRQADHRTRSTESPLGDVLRLQRGIGAARWGFFLRAETMHGFFTYLEENPGDGGAAVPRDEPRRVVPRGAGDPLRLPRVLLPRRARGGAVVLLDAGADVARSTGSPATAGRCSARPTPRSSRRSRAEPSLEVGPWGLRRTTWEELELRAALEGVPRRAGTLPAARAGGLSRPGPASAGAQGASTTRTHGTPSPVGGPVSGCGAAGQEHRVGAVPVRPQLERAGQRPGGVGEVGQGRGGVEDLHVVAAVEHGAHHARGLGQHRRAGRVGHDPARPDRRQRGGEQRLLERAPAPRRRGRYAASATPVGGAAHRARSRVRRPAPGRTCRAPRRAGCRRPRPPRPGRRTRPRWRAATSTARCGCRSEASSRAPRSAASAASSADLPPGPAQTSSQRSSRPSTRRLREPERDQLRALVLHAGPALGHRGHRGRVAARQLHGVRRPDGGGCPGLDQLVHGRQAGPRDQHHARGGVVGGEEVVELVGAVAQRLGQRVDDPARVGVRDGGEAARVLRAPPAAPSPRGRARRPGAARRW